MRAIIQRLPSRHDNDNKDENDLVGLSAASRQPAQTRRTCVSWINASRRPKLCLSSTRLYGTSGRKRQASRNYPLANRFDRFYINIVNRKYVLYIPSVRFGKLSAAGKINFQTFQGEVYSGERFQSFSKGVAFLEQRT